MILLFAGLVCTALLNSVNRGQTWQHTCTEVRPMGKLLYLVFELFIYVIITWFLSQGWKDSNSPALLLSKCPEALSSMVIWLQNDVVCHQQFNGHMALHATWNLLVEAPKTTSNRCRVACSTTGLCTDWRKCDCGQLRFVIEWQTPAMKKLQHW